MSAFEGSFTVMVTPFTDGGAAVDEAALRRFVDWQIDAGVPGLVPLGSTGEFLSVSEDERRQVIETVVGQAAGRFDGERTLGRVGQGGEKALGYRTGDHPLAHAGGGRRLAQRREVVADMEKLHRGVG